MIDNSKHSRKDRGRKPILGSPAGPPTPPQGKASNYIRHVCVEIRPGDRVILCCRVSHHTQNQKGNLDNQEENLRGELERLGAVVVEVVRHEGPGWDGRWLVRAAAKAMKHGAKLVAESTNRFVRSLEYHSKKNPDAQASEEDLYALRCWTTGVTLVTLLDPDATAAEERSYQTIRGQRAKDRKGGRPAKHPPGYKLDRRQKMLDQVLSLCERGFSVRTISAWTCVPKSTVYDWTKSEQKQGKQGVAIG
jgi:hypothetical protein